MRTDHLVAVKWAVPVLATLRLPLLDYRLRAEALSLNVTVVATSCQSLILLVAGGIHSCHIIGRASTFRVDSSAAVLVRLYLQTAVDRRVIHLRVDMVHLVWHHLH